MAQYFSPRVVTNGLILYVDAGNVKSYAGSGTSALDMSGNSYNVSLTNGPTYSQSNGGIIVMDGTNDYATTSSNLGISGTSSRTFECWFYPLSTATKNIMGYGSANSGLLFDALIGIWNGYFSVICHYYGANNDTLSTLPSRDTLVLNAWNQVVLTYDGTTIFVYTNGVLSNSKSASLNTSNSAFLLGKGQYNYAPYDFINANFSLARVYNRALSQDEILQNFNAIRGRFNI